MKQKNGHQNGHEQNIWQNEWSFIEAVMRKIGFSEIWITWIMRCITLVKYKVLMNDQPMGNIIPERGLRQRDHLFPFIFILCTEALVSLLNHAENQGRLRRCALHECVHQFLTFSLLMITFSFVRQSPVSVKKWWKWSGFMDKHLDNVLILKNLLYSLVRKLIKMLDSR